MAHASGVNLTDIVLKGEVTRLDTSTSGQIVLQGTSAGSSTVVLTMPSATLQETTAIVKTGRARTWNLSSTAAKTATGDSQGTSTTSATGSATQSAATQTGMAQAGTADTPVAQTITALNTKAINPNGTHLFPAVGWFFPYLFVRNAYTAGDKLILSSSARPGDEPKDIHIAMRWKSPSPTEDTYRLHAGTLPDSVTIDPETMLVKTAVFMMVQHSSIQKTPWTTQSPAFEEKVEYSDYRKVQGVPIPMRIQVSINRRPLYNIRFSTASLNTGITIATPED